jgi:hypothetical protein
LLKNKSLLVLFFRKEQACLALGPIRPVKPRQPRGNEGQRGPGQRTQHHGQVEFTGSHATQKCTDRAAQDRETGRFWQTQSKIHVHDVCRSLKIDRRVLTHPNR